MNNKPRNIFVLTIATMLRTLDILVAKIWVMTPIPATTKNIVSIVNRFKVIDIMKNQNDIPAVTANALNLGDDNSILNWINECN